MAEEPGIQSREQTSLRSWKQLARTKESSSHVVIYELRSPETDMEAPDSERQCQRKRSSLTQGVEIHPRKKLCSSIVLNTEVGVANRQ